VNRSQPIAGNVLGPAETGCEQEQQCRHSDSLHRFFPQRLFLMFAYVELGRKQSGTLAPKRLVVELTMRTAGRKFPAVRPLFERAERNLRPGSLGIAI
jgi:hypothetical protein